MSSLEASNSSDLLDDGSEHELFFITQHEDTNTKKQNSSQDLETIWNDDDDEELPESLGNPSKIQTNEKLPESLCNPPKIQTNKQLSVSLHNSSKIKANEALPESLHNQSKIQAKEELPESLSNSSKIQAKEELPKSLSNSSKIQANKDSYKRNSKLCLKKFESSTINLTDNKFKVKFFQNKQLKVEIERLKLTAEECINLSNILKQSKQCNENVTEDNKKTSNTKRYSQTTKNKKITKSIHETEFNKEDLMKPLRKGWIRLVVTRGDAIFINGVAKSRKDIYYYSPTKVKLRSSKELERFLEKNKTPFILKKHFCFAQTVIGLGEPYEVERRAFSKNTETNKTPPPQDPPKKNSKQEKAKPIPSLKGSKRKLQDADLGKSCFESPLRKVIHVEELDEEHEKKKCENHNESTSADQNDKELHNSASGPLKLPLELLPTETKHTGDDLVSSNVEKQNSTCKSEEECKPKLPIFQMKFEELLEQEEESKSSLSEVPSKIRIRPLEELCESGKENYSNSEFYSQSKTFDVNTPQSNRHHIICVDTTKQTCTPVNIINTPLQLVKYDVYSISQPVNIRNNVTLNTCGGSVGTHYIQTPVTQCYSRNPTTNSFVAYAPIQNTFLSNESPKNNTPIACNVSTTSDHYKATPKGRIVYKNNNDYKNIMASRNMQSLVYYNKITENNGHNSSHSSTELRKYRKQSRNHIEDKIVGNAYHNTRYNSFQDGLALTQNKGERNFRHQNMDSAMRETGFGLSSAEYNASLNPLNVSTVSAISEKEQIQVDDDEGDPLAIKESELRLASTDHSFRTLVLSPFSNKVLNFVNFGYLNIKEFENIRYTSLHGYVEYLENKLGKILGIRIVIGNKVQYLAARGFIQFDNYPNFNERLIKICQFKLEENFLNYSKVF